MVSMKLWLKGAKSKDTVSSSSLRVLRMVSWLRKRLGLEKRWASRRMSEMRVETSRAW